MKKYQDFKYKIRIRLDGRYLFAVWWADANAVATSPYGSKLLRARRRPNEP